MDIITHTLSGFAVGTVIASFSSKGWKWRSAIILFSGLGGALPDIDAISMWSRFDDTIGKFFSLQHSGKIIYSEKFWYSHHSFMHSLTAAVLIALIIGLLFYLFNKRKTPLTQVFRERKLILIGFILGFVIHLLQDMITPASSWGGVRLFFPSKIYVGGMGSVWWWNNYNLFIVVILVLIINLCLLLFLAQKVKSWKYTTIVFLIGLICFITQIKRINYNFNGKKYANCEQKSKDIQREILGDKVYKIMVKLDNSLKLHF